MSLTDFECAPAYQALDDSAFADGAFVSAHELRALSRSVNHLVRGKGHELLTLTFDQLGVFEIVFGDNEKSSLNIAAPLSWARLVPGRFMRPKMPGLNKMSVFFQGSMIQGTKALIQVETLRAPVNLSADVNSPRTATLVGQFPGISSNTILNDIEIDEGPYERLGFWVKALLPTDTPLLGASIADYAGVDPLEYIGTMTRDSDTQATLVVSQFDLSSPQFNTSNSSKTLAGNHYVAIVDKYVSLGIDYAHPPNYSNSVIYRGQITAVKDESTLLLYPPPAFDPGRFRSRVVYILPVPILRIGAICCHAEPRPT